MLVFALPSSFVTHAQNNPYKINDKLFALYDKSVKSIRSADVPMRADTMFFRAKEIGDLKAQCLALNLKADHYYFTNQMPLFRIEMKKAQDFAIKTPYKQYYFAPWNRLIAYLIRSGGSGKAIEELTKYQEEAFKLKNDYAIGHSYYMFANFYSKLGQIEKSVEMFEKEVAYGKQTNNVKDLAVTQIMIGRQYRVLRNLKKAEESLKLALTMPAGEKERMHLLANNVELLYIYALNGDSIKEKKTLDEVCHLMQNLKMSASTQDYVYGVLMLYYEEKKDFKKLMDLLPDIKEPAVKLYGLHKGYWHLGDYAKSYSALVLLNRCMDSIRSANDYFKLSEMAKAYDQERLEYDNQQIELKTMEQMLQQSRSERELQAEEERRAQMELESRSMEMQAQSENLRRQQIELSRTKSERQRREARKAYVAEQDKLDKTLLALLYAFSVVFVAGMVYYVVTRNRSKRRLEQERASAVAAELEAEQANRQKSLFLQNVSHEIRTPLNAIVGFNELLNDEDAELEEEDRKEFLGLISENSEQLMNTINDILDLSKLESGKYAVRHDEILVPELCRMAMLSVREEGYEGVERIVRVSDECAEMTIATDCERVLQLLCNLLDNACKFTEQGSVTLSCEAVGTEPLRSIRMIVTDTGCGIPAEKSEAVFERFEKLDDFKVGTGLGLSICKSIARLLGGSVWLDSDYSDGARFCFEFPLFQPETEEKSEN